METGASVSVAPNPRKASAPRCAVNLPFSVSLLQFVVFDILTLSVVSLVYNSVIVL